MLARESVPYLLVTAVWGILFYILLPVLAILPAAAFLFILFFFRNPARRVVQNEAHVLSPADGRVQAIEAIDHEDTFIRGRAVKISIFLSIFNVHFNRSPINGKITYTAYRPGKHLPAFKSHASGLNEKNTAGIENSRIRVLVHQITGFLARRVVFYPRRGDYLEQGQVFGLIKFGSCTEIIVPANVKVLVREGQKVTAGITVIGVLKDD